jgi:hypothetical protein
MVHHVNAGGPPIHEAGRSVGLRFLADSHGSEIENVEPSRVKRADRIDR